MSGADSFRSTDFGDISKSIDKIMVDWKNM